MSVTIGGTIQFRRDTAANWTSANPTLLSGEVGFETDTGKFKIGDGSTAWTSLAYAAAESVDWSDITSKPSTFTPATHTHPQSDITNLTTDLAGKASTSHTHAASDITSGTVATARLGSGTANSTTFLRGDQTWQTVSGGSGTDRGDLFDVRTYGALLGYAEEDATTTAFQDAVDAIETAGGGTLYIPATDIADGYFLRRPIWCGVDNLTVVGEGDFSTNLVSYGPAFITTKHPKYWDCAQTTYTDVDTSGTVTIKTGGIVTDRSRYRMDLTEFMSGGDFAPGGGKPALDGLTGAGFFGLRTRRGVMGGRYPYCPLATGNNSSGSSFFTRWADYDKIEWNFIVYHHESYLVGGIAGGGSFFGPDPWHLAGSGTDYYFELALTDSDGVERTWLRCVFPQTSGVGIHRITIQFDPAAATDADRIRASVNRTRVAVTRYNFSDNVKEYHAMNTANSSGDFTNLWTRWNRVANWCGSDFTICNESAKVGDRTSEMGTGSYTDYTVLLVSAFNEFKHAFGSIGATITKVGGAAADDSFVWPYTSGADSDATAIGWMANETYNDWSPADTDDDINLMAFGRGRSKCWGYMHPKANGDSITATKKNITFRNFNIKARDNHQNSCGILIGAILNTNLENMRFSEGFYFSIGMLRNRTCYPLRWNNLKPSKGIHISDSSVWGRDWDFGYARNCMILTTGTELHLDGFYGLEYDALSTGYFRCHAGSSLNAGLSLKNGNFNMEGVMYSPAQPGIYYQKAYNHPNNRVVIEDVNFGDAASKGLYIDDTLPDSPARTLVDVKRTGFGSGNTILTVRGSKAYGTVEIDPHVYINDVNEYLDTYGSGTTAANYAGVKTIDKESFGLPSCGVFVDRMHEIHVKRPAQGAPSKWIFTGPPNSQQVQNTSGSIVWLPTEFNGSDRYQHALSANFVPSLYAEATLPWPVSGSTTVAISGVTVGMGRSMLNTLLTGATAPDRATMSLRWGGDYISHISTGTSADTFFGIDSLTNSSYWASAGATSQREKRTNADISVAGKDAPAWTVKVRRRWSWGLHLGTSKTLFIAGRTNRIEPADWQGMGTSNYTLASGNLRIGLRSGTSGYVNTVAHQVLDWMTGGSFPAGIPSTLYFGLSSTAVTLGSPTATEPSSGGYARVALARNSTNFGETGDAGYIWSNKVPIEFPSPSGADWGYLKWLVVYDAATSGNIIAAAPLNRPVRVRDGDEAPVFLPGAIQFSL